MHGGSLKTQVFVDIDNNKSTLSVKDRLAIKRIMDCLGYFYGNCRFFEAMRLNLFIIVALHA